MFKISLDVKHGKHFNIANDGGGDVGEDGDDDGAEVGEDGEDDDIFGQGCGGECSTEARRNPAQRPSHRGDLRHHLHCRHRNHRNRDNDFNNLLHDHHRSTDFPSLDTAIRFNEHCKDDLISSQSSSP